MIYGINDSPKTLKEYILYGAQQCISILTATILISTLCGTSVAAGLVGAGIATLVFLILTKFKAPLFYSNSGATVAAVLTALTIGHDYTGVILGGVTICVMNTIAAIGVKKMGSEWVSKLLPPVVSGTIVLVIGLNLATFCPTYVGMGTPKELINMVVAFITMLITVIVMYYGKGMISTLPFLCGVIGGYLISIPLGLVDFTQFNNMQLFILPDFAFLNINLTTFDWSTLGTIIVVFGAVNLAAIGEHVSDVLVVGAIVEEDLTKTVGLHKTLLGDGVADMIGCFIGGQPTTSYGESLSTIAVSRVASTKVIAVAAILTIMLGFFGPFNAFIMSIPSCIFGGIALVAYGCIAHAGIKVLTTIDMSNKKNMIIFAVMATVGVSGIAFNIGKFSLTTIALSMVTGLILNALIKEN